MTNSVHRTVRSIPLQTHGIATNVNFFNKLSATSFVSLFPKQRDAKFSSSLTPLLDSATDLEFHGTHIHLSTTPHLTADHTGFLEMRK